MKTLLPSVRIEMLAMIERTLAIADEHELWEVAIGLDSARLALGSTRLARHAASIPRQGPTRH